MAKYKKPVFDQSLPQHKVNTQTIRKGGSNKAIIFILYVYCIGRYTYTGIKYI